MKQQIQALTKELEIVNVTKEMKEYWYNKLLKLRSDKNVN